MKRVCAVSASVAATVVPFAGAAVVWFVEPHPWLPLALFAVFVVWCWWAQVVDPVGAFVRPWLWFLLVGMVVWNPVLAGVVPVWLVSSLWVLFAGLWWRAVWRFGALPRVRFSFRDDGPEPDPVPVSGPSRPRDVTRTDRAVQDFGDGVMVGYGPPSTNPDVLGSRERTVQAVSRYSNVVIDTPDGDDNDEPAVLADVRRVWPEGRGKAHLTVLAELLGRPVNVLRSELVDAGVTIDPACSAKRPGKDGTRSTQAGIDRSQIDAGRG